MSNLDENKNVNKNANEHENNKKSIEVLTPEVFDGGMKTKLISTIDMADVVSSFFAPAFSDYYGCNIRINDGRNPIIANTMPIGAIYVDLYFKDMGPSINGAWKNIIPRHKEVNKDDTDRTDIGSRFLRFNGMMNNKRMYNVTKETYEVLDSFTFSRGRTRWNEHTTETCSSMSVYGKEEVVICISGLDLNKIISKIYGEERKYEYIAVPATIIPNKTQEFIIQITQLEKATIGKLQRDLGMFTINSTQFHQYHR